jgi:hypothetical protein
MDDWVVLPSKKERDAIEAKARLQQKREDEERLRRKGLEMETRRKAEEQLKINAAMKRDIKQLQEREKEREKKPVPSSQRWSDATKTMTLQQKSDFLQKMMRDKKRMEEQEKKDMATELKKDLKRLAALSAKKGGRKTRKFFNKKKKTMKRRKGIKSLKRKTYKRK